MKKVIVALAAGLLSLCLFGCSEGASEENSNGESSGGTENVEPAEPLNLSGTWVQINSESEDSYQQAVIEDDYMTINWVNPDSEALYWAGTFVAPTEPGDSYAWSSENDTEKTGTALLASSDATKDFTYANGRISYELTAMGVTMTVEMERQE